MELKNTPKVGLELNLVSKVILGTIVTTCIALVFLGIAHLMPTEDSKAATTGTTYQINGNSNDTTNLAIYSQLQNGDTLLITGALPFILKDDLDLSDVDIVILIDGGTLLFDDAFSIYLSADADIIIKNGGQLKAKNSKKSSNMAIWFGSTKLISWDGTGATYSFDDMNNMGGFTTLPVSLISFDGNLEGDHVVLNWSTAMEENNSHFYVQRSEDGVLFETLTKVKGKGNSSAKVDYNATDEFLPVAASTVFYRLIQVDYDGESETFQPIAIALNNTKTKINVFPNPATDQVTVEHEGEEFIASLIDQTGNLVATENSVNGVTKFNTTSLAAGIYFVSVESNSEMVESHKIVVKH